MKIKQIAHGKEFSKPQRNHLLAIYIACVSAFMISYSVVTVVQYL